MTTESNEIPTSVGDAIPPEESSEGIGESTPHSCSKSGTRRAQMERFSSTARHKNFLIKAAHLEPWMRLLNEVNGIDVR